MASLLAAATKGTRFAVVRVACDSDHSEPTCPSLDMKEQLLGFFDALRQAGLAPSVSESLDAAAAVAPPASSGRSCARRWRPRLVKDHAERAVVRRRVRPLLRRCRRERRRAASAAAAPREGDGSGRGGPAAGRAAQPQRRRRRAGEEERREQRAGEPRERSAHGARAGPAARAARASRSAPWTGTRSRRCAIWSPSSAAACACAGRAAWRRAKRGRLDLRRTIRRALSRGGVPIELLLRAPRPGKTDLLALVDLSYSTATAAEFLLALLAPARRFFRRVQLARLRRPPVPRCRSRVATSSRTSRSTSTRAPTSARCCRLLDERYDVGLGRNTVLLVLGDARNNRRPPRADLLPRLRRRVRRSCGSTPSRASAGTPATASWRRTNGTATRCWQRAARARWARPWTSWHGGSRSRLLKNQPAPAVRLRLDLPTPPC